MDGTQHDDCCNLTVTGRPVRIPSVRSIDPRRFTTCYLCREPIKAEPSRDHVPPKQFFPKVFRKANTTDQSSGSQRTGTATSPTSATRTTSSPPSDSLQPHIPRRVTRSATTSETGTAADSSKGS